MFFSDNKLTEQPIRAAHCSIKKRVPDSVTDTINRVAARHVPYTGSTISDRVTDTINHVAAGAVH